MSLKYNSVLWYQFLKSIAVSKSRAEEFLVH